MDKILCFDSCNQTWQWSKQQCKLSQKNWPHMYFGIKLTSISDTFFLYGMNWFDVKKLVSIFPRIYGIHLSISSWVNGMDAPWCIMKKQTKTMGHIFRRLVDLTLLLQCYMTLGPRFKSDVLTWEWFFADAYQNLFTIGYGM